MEKPLPCFELLIDQSVESEVQVNYVALVDRPATDRNFLAFNEFKPLEFASINDEEKIVVGAAMVPDMLIYRTDETGEYNVVFSKETVKQIAEKFYTKSFQNNANLMHNPDLKAEGVTFFLSFIRNTDKGMIGLAGDYPEGTWFLGAKVNNEEVWKKIKAGEVKGFSVEGIFKYAKEKMSAIPKDIETILNDLDAFADSLEG
jgi:hypothetical protein